MAIDTDPRLQRLLDESDLRALVYQYCRGIDRRQMDLVRSCYHPDAYDDHGAYAGDVDGFIEHVETGLEKFERTMHTIGNIAIEIDGDRARTEAYAVCFHLLPARGSKPVRDWIVALRYVDDLERRGGEWRIASRRCVFEWARMFATTAEWPFPGDYATGRRDTSDAIFNDPPPTDR